MFHGSLVFLVDLVYIVLIHVFTDIGEMYLYYCSNLKSQWSFLLNAAHETFSSQSDFYEELLRQWDFRCVCLHVGETSVYELFF